MSAKQEAVSAGRSSRGGFECGFALRTACIREQILPLEQSALIDVIARMLCRGTGNRS